MPPLAYARGHDDAIWATLQEMLGEWATAKPFKRDFPVALGGLGLQSAQLTAPAAYRAAWAEALPAYTRAPYTHACSGAQLATSSLSKPSLRKPRAASRKRRMLVVSCWTGVGATAPRARDPRRHPPRPCNEPRRRRLAARLAIPCFVRSCRPCRPVPVRCFALRRGRMLEHGSPLYPAKHAKAPPPSRRKRCKSL